MSEERRKPGRPPKYGPRTNNTVRLTQKLSDQIDAAARAAGRSRSEEIEYRLMRSFDLPAFAEEVASQVVAKLKDCHHG